METIINRGYKFKIAPTKDQKQYLSLYNSD